MRYASSSYVGRLSECGEDWPRIPCPTCAAHWRGVDEAVHAEREACLRDVACSLNPAAMACPAEWANGVTDGQRAAIRAINARTTPKEDTNGK